MWNKFFFNYCYYFRSGSRLLTAECDKSIKIYKEDEVIKAVHRNQTVARYWHAYTDKQIAVVEEICRVLVEAYPIKDILGHEEISPNRKIDPGPAFPLDKLRRLILDPDRSQDEGELDDFPVDGAVTASKLTGNAE